jgi:hypothetical protein
VYRKKESFNLGQELPIEEIPLEEIIPEAEKAN